MGNNILVCYKSVTGFTKRYAELIAAAADCTLMDLRDVNAETASRYDIVVFGGRLRAGTVVGLKKAKELAATSKVKTFAVFATGSMPAKAADTIRQVWENNLSGDELSQIPHFYLPGGLCYKKMPLPEKIIMKAFSAVMKSKIKKKKDKTAEDEEFERMISSSYDLSSEKYIEPLVSFLKKSNA